MAPTAAVAVEVHPAEEETKPPTDDLKTTDRHQRIKALLREIFEGHEEFLGCTPD